MADDAEDVVAGQDRTLRPKVLCGPNLLRPAVDSDDRSGPAQARALDDGETDPAAAEDGDAFARLNGGGKNCRADAGRNCASDERRDVEWHNLPDLHAALARNQSGARGGAPGRH